MDATLLRVVLRVVLRVGELAAASAVGRWLCSLLQNVAVNTNSVVKIHASVIAPPTFQVHMWDTVLLCGSCKNPQQFLLSRKLWINRGC